MNIVSNVKIEHPHNTKLTLSNHSLLFFVTVAVDFRHQIPSEFMAEHTQGQYWIEYLYLLLATPPYMAAANFVVITNGGGCALTGTADIDQ